MLLGELDERLVLDTSGSDENHAVRSVVLLDVVLQVRLADGEDVLAWSEDGASEGLAWMRLKMRKYRIVPRSRVALFI